MGLFLREYLRLRLYQHRPQLQTAEQQERRPRDDQQRTGIAEYSPIAAPEKLKLYYFSVASLYLFGLNGNYSRRGDR
jgi:hypothetical protein